MIIVEFVIINIFIFCVGVCFGVWSEDRSWRERGDHEYMNRKESGGNLYQVKRER